MPFSKALNLKLSKRLSGDQTLSTTLLSATAPGFDPGLGPPNNPSFGLIYSSATRKNAFLSQAALRHNLEAMLTVKRPSSQHTDEGLLILHAPQVHAVI